jgi:ATP-binding cassette subfamily B (MDR/TAP) protein 1
MPIKCFVMTLTAGTKSVSDVSSGHTCKAPFAQASTNSAQVDGAATCQDPSIGTSDIDQKIRAKWSSLFNFTTRGHVAILAAGVVCAVLSGIVIPITSILFGKLFDSFASYGAADISGDELVSRTSTYAIALAVLGSLSWLLNGLFFMLWIVFGELQAKTARDSLFQGLLYKDMEWFDLQKDGVSALIPRFQT